MHIIDLSDNFILMLFKEVWRDIQMILSMVNKIESDPLISSLSIALIFIAILEIIKKKGYFSKK